MDQDQSKRFDFTNVLDGRCYSLDVVNCKNSPTTRAELIISKRRIPKKKKTRLSIKSECSTISDGKYFEKTDDGLKVIKGTAIARYRRRLSGLLHTNTALVLACLLAILDTGCVIGQIITDILLVKEELHDIERTTNVGTQILSEAFPFIFNGTEIAGSHGHNFKRIIHALEAYKARIRTSSQTHSHELSTRHRRDVSGVEDVRNTMPVFEHLAESLHVASLTILSALFLATIIKIFAMGKRIKKNKVEVFDVFVVIVSWCINISLCTGFPSFSGTESAQILVFILPWRVIRIVNSFVLIIQQNDNVTLKTAKQHYRESLKKTDEWRKKADYYKMEIRELRSLAKKLGATENDVKSCYPLEKRRRSSLLNIILQTRRSSFPCIKDIREQADNSSSSETDIPQQSLRIRRRSLTYLPTHVGFDKNEAANMFGKVNLGYFDEGIPEEPEIVQTKL